MIAGTTVGQYRIVRPVGEGGMGTVYLAEHVLLGRRAAIKVLLPSLSAQKEIVERFFNEARATTAISDPGIVQVFDFGFHTDGTAFLVMEFLEGESLELRIRSLGRLSVYDALRVTRQAATSLGAAHASGIVHRDLKPDNIFLVRDHEAQGGERPKILDFGIAKLGGDEPGRMRTRTGAILGTPVFMSPEQCRGAGAVDHRADIYSLGCVLFTMLTGRPLFECEGVGETIAAHLREPARAPSTLAPFATPAVDALVLRCLAKSPDDRFASMAELVRGVESVMAGLSAPGGANQPTIAMAPYVTGAEHAAHAQPTTLSTATIGQTHLTGGGRRSTWIALGMIVAVGGAVAAVMVASGGARPRHDAPAPAAAVVAAPPIDAAAPVPDAAPALDAAPAPIVDAGADAAPPDAHPQVRTPTGGHGGHHGHGRSTEDLYDTR